MPLLSSVSRRYASIFLLSFLIACWGSLAGCNPEEKKDEDQVAVGGISLGIAAGSQFGRNAPIPSSGQIQVQITATLTNKEGNPVKTGTTVRFKTSSGQIMDKAKTDPNGVALVTLSSANASPGRFTVTAEAEREETKEKASMDLVWTGAIDESKFFVRQHPENFRQFSLVVADINGNPLSDGTSLNCQASIVDPVTNQAGTVSFGNTVINGAIDPGANRTSFTFDIPPVVKEIKDFVCQLRTKNTLATQNRKGQITTGATSGNSTTVPSSSSSTPSTNSTEATLATSGATPVIENTANLTENLLVASLTRGEAGFQPGSPGFEKQPVRFAFTLESFNVPAYVKETVNQVKVRLGDENGAPLTNTLVNLTTSAGVVVPAQAHTDDEGKIVVSWFSSSFLNPSNNLLPEDGHVSITAKARGNEASVGLIWSGRVKTFTLIAPSTSNYFSLDIRDIHNNPIVADSKVTCTVTARDTRTGGNFTVTSPPTTLASSGSSVTTTTLAKPSFTLEPANFGTNGENTSFFGGIVFSPAIIGASARITCTLVSPNEHNIPISIGVEYCFDPTATVCL